MIHLCGALCLAVAALPWWVRLAGWLMLGAGLVHSLRRHAWLTHPRSVVSLDCHRDGQWRIVLRDGASLSARRLPGSFVHPWLVVPVFRAARRDWPVVLLPDGAAPAALRRLRILLRWGAPRGDARQPGFLSTKM